MTIACDGAFAAKYRRPGAIGSVARRISRTEKCDCRNFECTGEVKRTGVATDKKRGATGKSDELRDCGEQSSRTATTQFRHRDRKCLLAGSVIHDRRDPVAAELASHFTEPLSGPALRAPARTGIEDRKSINGELPQSFVAPLLRVGRSR